MCVPSDVFSFHLGNKLLKLLELLPYEGGSKHLLDAERSVLVGQFLKAAEA